MGDREDILRDGGRDLFGRFFDLSLGMLCIAGFDGFFKKVNPAMIKILGWTEEELLSRPWIEFVHPEDRQLTEAARENLVGGEEILHFENRYQGKDGLFHWFSWTSMPVLEQERIFAVALDITKQKQMEEELHRCRLDLERQVQERTAVLAGINRIFREAPFCVTEEQLGRVSLAAAQKLTGSKFGYIGEMDQAGKFRTIAISNPKAPASEMPVSAALQFLKYLEVRGLRGRVMKSGKTLIFNDLSSHPDWMEPPKGFPAIASFLGVPLKHAGQTFGMIGLVNREGGFNQRNQEDMGVLAVSVVEALRGKRAEWKLAQLRRHHELILSSTSEGILGIDLDGNMTFVNPAAAKMLGYEAEELLGRNSHAVWHHSKPDGSPYPLEECPVLETLRGKVRLAFDEDFFWRKDGTGLPVKCSRNPIIQNDQISGAVVTFWDITERKQAETALQESEEKYRTLVETTDTGYLILDSQGQVTDANQEYVRLSGHKSLAEILGRSVIEWTAEHDRERNAAEVSKCLQQGYVRGLEIDYVDAEGRITPIEINATVITTGQYLQIVSLCRDITERKKAEAELQRIAWLLRPKWDHQAVYEPAYGDPTKPNTCRVLLDAIGQAGLTDIANEYISLLGTSSAVYEKNGDYAVGILSSGWCRLLDQASYRQCHTDDLRQALASGQWHCHESCWTKASKAAIETGKATDIECDGGIRLYAAPIWANDAIVGAINFGYGDPPRDPRLLAEIAAKYGIPVAELRQEADKYETRPPFIIEIAKDRLLAAARLIGTMVERKQAEKEIARLASFPQLSPNPVLEVDNQGDITFANPAAHELAQKLDLPDLQALLPADLEKILFSAQEAGERQFRCEKRIKEEVFAIYINLVPQFQVSRLFFLDITERKRAAEVVRQSEEKFRRTFDQSPIGAAMVGLDFRYQRVNAELCRITGYAEEELTARTFVDITHPDDVALDVKLARRLAAGKIDHYSLEKRYLRKDGSTVWVRLSVRLIKDAAGKPLYYLPMIQDISAHKRAEENLRQSLKRLQKALAEIVQAMALTVEIRDPYTAGHQRRVTQLAQAIAREMGIPKEQQNAVWCAGTLHDLGKIYVPEGILSRPGELSDIELAMVKTHCQKGYEILQSIEFPWPVAQIVRQHHERLNGSGYPDGLLGEEILLEARILAVADVVEAMASHRPYRAALGINAALEEISRNRGVLFDPDAVDACIRVFKEKAFSFE